MMDSNSQKFVSHDENRKKVCAPCGRKSKTGLFINNNIKQLIKLHINSRFDFDNPRFPLGICGTCRLTLLDAGKGVFRRPMPQMPHFETIILPTATRGKKIFCNCYICLTARHKGNEKVKKGRGLKRNFNVIIDTPKGRRGNSNISSLPKKVIKNQECQHLYAVTAVKK